MADTFSELLQGIASEVYRMANIFCRRKCRQLHCQIETLRCWTNTNARLGCNLGHLEIERNLKVKGQILFLNYCRELPVRETTLDVSNLLFHPVHYGLELVI